MNESGFLGELGLVLLIIILAIICIPIFISIGIAFLIGMSGWGFYTVVIMCSVLIWILLYLILYY